MARQRRAEGHRLAVVPVRGMRGGKTRLSTIFGEEQRVALTGAMLRTVLGALTATEAVDGVGLVTPDPAVALACPSLGDRIELVRQPLDQGGLNRALALGRAWALERGAAVMLALSADLPLLTPSDVEAILAETAPVVVAPDRHGSGTNALLLRLHDPATHEFVFGFGQDSFVRHIAEADRLALPAAVVHRPGTAFDLDLPDDWAVLPTDAQARLMCPPRIAQEVALCRR